LYPAATGDVYDEILTESQYDFVLKIHVDSCSRMNGIPQVALGK